tara:strand:- start:252 stop:872 length:621 start_codon:yes stop_codon:yes gene_type:complete
MRWSDTTAKLDAALAEAQKQLQPAVKKARGHGYSYAGLDEVMDSAMKCLTSAGCSLSQGVDWVNGDMVMVTRIACSGEYLLTYFPMTAEGGKRLNAMQAMGSASTYGRRYAIQCALGIAPITEQQAAELQVSFRDDDGASSGGSLLSELKSRLLAYGPALRTHRDLLVRKGFQGMDDIERCQDEDALADVLENIQRSINGSARPRH